MSMPVFSLGGQAFEAAPLNSPEPGKDPLPWLTALPYVSSAVIKQKRRGGEKNNYKPTL